MSPDPVEKLIGEYLDRLNAGESLDPRRILAENPIHGGEILDALEKFVVLGAAEGDDRKALGTLGDYTLRRQIGRGGMGIVYEAWENSMDRRVALKVLPQGVAADARANARFLREAQAAGKLNHRNIVGVYSTGVREGTPWYSMEYIEGETLSQIMGRIKDAEPDSDTPFGGKDGDEYFGNLASAFAGVADGLQHAHSSGVIHRDLKPSNLILDGEGRLRILDFGLARLEGQESLTASGGLVGTPLYMSPEQARQKKIPVDHRTDIYSIGATLYEMLAWRPPFRGKDHRDTLSQIIERDPVEPRRINPRVPRDLETIAFKCLRKDPGDRYGTAGALAQDLRRFVMGEPVEARPRGRWEKVRRRIARRSRLIVLRALAIGLLLACGAFLYKVFLVDRPEGRFENAVVVEELDTPFGESSPVCSSDGLELYFGSRRPKEEGEEGREHDIWVVSRSDRGAAWGEPRNVEELNSPGQEEPGWLSADGLRLYYAKGEGRKKPLDICLATREVRHPSTRWEPFFSEELQAINTPAYNEGMPSLTEDECEIYFYSNRPGGAGNNDIWVAIRSTPNSPWSTPRNLDEINSIVHERMPSISSDGLTLWWTNASAGKIFQASRENRESRFGSARHVVLTESNYAWEGQFEVSLDWPAPGATAYFVRNRSEVKGRFDCDILMVTWNPSPGLISSSSLLETRRSSKSVTPRYRDSVQSRASLPVASGGITRFQEGYFQITGPAVLPQVVSLNGNVALSADGLTLYFGADTLGGPGGDDLWIARRERTIDENGEPVPFGEPFENLSEINSPIHERHPAISLDGKRLYFTRAGDVWMASREAVEDQNGDRIPFQPPVALTEINSPSIEAVPNISRHERFIFFHSDRPGGEGPRAIWMASREGIEDGEGNRIPFGLPVPLDEVNGSAYDVAPYCPDDGLTLFFSSNREGGSFDIYVASREKTESGDGSPVPFGSPVKLGPPLNSASDDFIGSISWDWPGYGAQILFKRGRDDGSRLFAVWRAVLKNSADSGKEGQNR